MENKFSELFSKLSEWLSGQEWFQQLRGKWDDLDPQSRLNLQIGAVAGTVLLIGFVIVNSFYSAHALRKELADKNDLLHLIQTANDELRSAKDLAHIGGETINWPVYLQSVATGAGIDAASLNVSSEKSLTTTDTTSESVIAVTAKHINIKQAVRYAFMIENGGKPVKLRNLLVDTKSDPSGYVDATYSLSAFTLKEAK